MSRLLSVVIVNDVQIIVNDVQTTYLFIKSSMKECRSPPLYLEGYDPEYRGKYILLKDKETETKRLTESVEGALTGGYNLNRTPKTR